MLWKLRTGMSDAQKPEGGSIKHDISVPVAQMPAFVEAVIPRVEAAFPGSRAIAFGHLGDGNVHFHVIAPAGVERASWETGEGVAISRMVYDLVCEWGGSISAEHGIGQSKRDELERLGDPATLDLMRKVKQALDPDELLNPGKLVTLAPPASSA